MRRVNLDAVEAEATGEPLEVEVDGRVFKVRPDLPWNTSALWAADRLDEATSALTVDPAEGADFAALILRGNPSHNTATARLNAVLNAAEEDQEAAEGDPVGEAPASSDS